MEKIYLENNKKLTKVSFVFANLVKNIMSKGQGTPLPVEIHLLQSPKIQHLTVKNAKLENLNLSSVTNLSSLILENVSVSEMDFQHNTKLSMVNVEYSCMQSVNIANPVRLYDLNLGADPSTGKVRYRYYLTRHSETHQRYGHHMVPSLHEITLPEEKMSELDLYQNKERSILHVGNSYKQFINFANAAMLRDLNLCFESLEEKYSYTYHASDRDEVKSFAVDICLPHTPHIHKLTIRKTKCENLDLSPVTNLRKLCLIEVTVMELDLTNNRELTKLDVTNCCITRINISKSTKTTSCGLRVWVVKRKKRVGKKL